MSNKKKKVKLFPLEEIKKEMFSSKEELKAYEKEHKEVVNRFKKEALGELGMQIRKIRKRLKISQDKLAEKLHTSKSTISRVEAGEQNLTVEYIIKVALALGRPFELKIY